MANKQTKTLETTWPRETNQNETNQNDTLNALLEQNSLLQEQIKEMNIRLQSISEKRSDDNIDYEPDDLKRRPPEGCYLRCYKDSPIVKTKLNYQEELDKFGNSHQVGVTIELETLSGKKTEIPYGSMLQNDYLNLEKKFFPFTDSIDETGASKIEKGVIIERGQVVVKRSPQEQIMIDGEMQGGQGRVQQVVRKDIRHYTVLVDGKKHTIHEDVLSK